MSISGRFEADFQSFYAAVDKAEAKLTDFQSGAGRVETSLNKMVDSFSGRRLIQEATLAAEAIERIGGATKLTEAQLQKVSAQATEAVAKMKAMGIEVPPNIQKVADALKPVNTELGIIQRSAADFATKFATAFAVEKIIDFALGVGKAQQQLSRLSAETQIGLSDLQDLTGATSDYGLANDELAKALFNVQKGISGGDASVSRGLHQIGLTLDDLKDKRGKELFLDIERGLAQLQGSLRDSAAADIFGSKLGAAMAGFAKEAEGAIAKAEEFNVKLSDKEVADLKAYADEVDHLSRNLGTLKDKVLGGVAGSINSITEAAKNGSSWWKLLGASVSDAFSRATGQPAVALFTEIAIAQGKVLEEQNKIKASHQEQVAELSKEAQAVQFLTALRLDAGQKLEGYQIRGLESLRELGQLNQQNAAAIGVSVDQFKKYTEEVRQAETATKALAQATIDQGAQLEKIQSTVTETLTKQRATQTEIELAQIKRSEEAEIQSINKRAASLKASLTAQHADTVENLAKIDADTASATTKVLGYFDQLRDGVGVDWEEIRKSGQAALDDTADRAQKTFIEASTTVGITREKVQELAQKWRDAEFAATAAGRAQVEGQTAATDATKSTNEELDRQKKKQEEIAASVPSSFSFDVTAANFDQVQTTGLDRQGIIALLKKGFSLENAMEIARAAKRGVQLDLSKWPEELRGPRVPGFKYGVENFAGGAAIVGEDGPEIVNLPFGSSVLPMKGGKRGGERGTSIYSPVYVSGVFDPSSAHALSRVVSAGIFRGVSNARIMS